jgi:hypothetical protein
VSLAGILTGTSSTGTVSVASEQAAQAQVAGSTERTEAVADLLERRGQAVRTRDRAAFLATVDPQASQFRWRQEALFDNLSGVPLSEWSYRLDAGAAYELPGVTSSAYDAAVWAPKVELAYALAGVEQSPAVVTQVLTFVHRDAGWFVAADDDLAEAGHPTPRELWDFGPVVAVRGRSSLVLSHPEHAVAAAGLTGEVDDAVTDVTSVWGPDWARSVVTVIPGSQQEMTALVGDALALDRIAAVATASSTEPVRGQRVVINPDNLDLLGLQARGLVIRHEIVHLATRGATSPDAPAWLVEGFADYVGYLGSGVPLRSAAADLATAVQRGDIPSGLPDAASFHGDSPRLGQAYQEAWLACLLLAERVGQQGLLRFYRTAASDPAMLEAAMNDVLGTTYRQFVEDWQKYLVERLG